MKKKNIGYNNKKIKELLKLNDIEINERLKYNYNDRRLFCQFLNLYTPLLLLSIT